MNSQADGSALRSSGTAYLCLTGMEDSAVESACNGGVQLLLFLVDNCPCCWCLCWCLNWYNSQVPASVPPPLDAAQTMTPQPFKPTRLQPDTSASGAANRKRSRSTVGLGQKTPLSFLESFRGASQQFSVSTKSDNTITGLPKEQISGSVAVCPVQLFPCSVCGRTFAEGVLDHPQTERLRLWHLLLL